MARLRRHRPAVSRWLVRAGVGLLVAPAVAGLVLVAPLRWIDPPTSAFMLQDTSGRVPVLYEWINRSEIGSASALAVVAAEDQKFAEHSGFDLQSIRKSFEAFDEGAKLRGASTITQQVAKNLYLWPGRNFVRKGIEAYFTILIELTWPKERILEVYLNIVELGPGVYGVAAASRHFFGENPSRLSDSQAALLAAVLPNPRQLRVDRPSEYVRERQRWITTHMARLRREGWRCSPSCVF